MPRNLGEVGKEAVKEKKSAPKKDAKKSELTPKLTYEGNKRKRMGRPPKNVRINLVLEAEEYHNLAEIQKKIYMEADLNLPFGKIVRILARQAEYNDDMIDIAEQVIIDYPVGSPKVY